MHIKINKNYLSYDKYKVKCALGKRGIGTKKKEGDKITPIGRYNIKFLLYRKDRIKKNKGSAIFIHVAKKNYKKTLGCIAISKISLLKMIKKLNRKSIVEISNQR